jgi:hypothetical protein
MLFSHGRIKANQINIALGVKKMIAFKFASRSEKYRSQFTIRRITMRAEKLARLS